MLYNGCMNYVLKLFDLSLIEFSISRASLTNDKYEITRVYENNKSLLPIGFELSNDGLKNWLSSRIAPKNREYVDSILSRVGLARNDIPGIILVCKYLSLNDCYWVDDVDSKLTFDQVNLFDNPFKTIIARIAFTGYGTSTRASFSSSPEFTTNGMLPKCWRRIKNKIYLYKGGTSGARNTGNEPYSEYYASKIAERMGLKHISYKLTKWKGTLCSVCELFTSREVSFVPIYKFVNKNDINMLIGFFKSLGEDVYEDFASMMVFDSIIFNTDRHLGNYGLLVDSSTNKIIGFAPIFDNGLSLFNYGLEDDFANLDKYSKTRVTTFEGLSFDDLLKMFLGKRQKEEVKKLINFKLPRSGQYKMDEYRLKGLDTFIQKRINKFLK